MSYTPTTWADGDVISATKMNKIEQQLSTLSNNIVFTGEEKLVDGVDVNGQKMYVGLTYSYGNVQYEENYELLVYFSDISLEDFLNYKYIINNHDGVDYYMVLSSIHQTTIKEGMTYLNSLSDLDPGIYYGLSSNCSGIIGPLQYSYDNVIILPTTAQIGSRTVVASAGEA